jgi:hypothetical protein
MENKIVEVAVVGMPGYPGADNQANIFKLQFDFNKIVEAEEAAGCNLFSALGNLRSLNARQARGLLLAMLRTHHPEITLAEAGQLVNADMGAVLEALAIALGAGEPEPVPVDPEA